jgi:carbon storage regulator
MLMVTRRIGERNVIGEGVEIVITEIHRQSVRVAVKAPPGHVIFRGEVWDKIAQANREAAEAASALDADKLAVIDALDTSPTRTEDATRDPSAEPKAPTARPLRGGLKPLMARPPKKTEEP